MIKRCYTRKPAKSEYSYLDSTVCDDWLIFSNFQKWMDLQNWEGKHLDKDLIDHGNKVYSPEKCLFIPPDINCTIASLSYIYDNNSYSGVDYATRRGMYFSRVSDHKGKNRHLGFFESKEEAYKEWLKAKRAQLDHLASGGECSIISDALRRLSLKIKIISVGLKIPPKKPKPKTKKEKNFWDDY